MEYNRKNLKEQIEDHFLREKQKAEKEKLAKQRKAGFDGRWYTDINNTTKGKITEIEQDDEDGESDKEVEEKDDKYASTGYLKPP